METTSKSIYRVKQFALAVCILLGTLATTESALGQRPYSYSWPGSYFPYLYNGQPLLETAQQRGEFCYHLYVMVTRHRAYVNVSRRHYILTRPSPYGPIRQRDADHDQAARQLKQAQSALFQVMEVRNIFMQLNLKGQSPHREWASVNTAYNKNLREIKQLTTGVAQAGALSWDGSFIARKVVAMDDTKVSFEGGQKKEWLSTVNTAAVFFGPMSLAQANKLKAKRPGVLLASGDFMEGTFKSLANGTVVVDSVLFGRKSFRVGSKAVALWLRNPRPRTANVLTQAWAKADNVKLGDLGQLQHEHLKLQGRLRQLTQLINYSIISHWRLEQAKQVVPPYNPRFFDYAPGRRTDEIKRR